MQRAYFRISRFLHRYVDYIAPKAAVLVHRSDQTHTVEIQWSSGVKQLNAFSLLVFCFNDTPIDHST